jgi:hypothetical protein
MTLQCIAIYFSSAGCLRSGERKLYVVGVAVCYAAVSIGIVQHSTSTFSTFDFPISRESEFSEGENEPWRVCWSTFHSYLITGSRLERLLDYTQLIFD